MRRIAVILLALLTGCSNAPESAKVEPKALLAFTSERVVLGDLPWGITKRADLELRNLGSTPTTLLNVSTSCTCAVPMERSQLIGRTLAPGERMALPMTLDAGTQASTIERSISVVYKSASSETPLTAAATIIANVIATYDVAPNTISFGEISLGAGETPLPKAVAFSSDSARLLGATVEGCESFACTADLRNPHRVTMTVGVITDKLMAGFNTGRLLLKTDDPYNPQYSMPINAFGKAALTPMPARVFLRPGAKPASVRFVDSDGAVNELKSARSDFPGVRLSIFDGAVLVELMEATPHEVSVAVTDARGRKGRFLVSGL